MAINLDALRAEANAGGACYLRRSLHLSTAHMPSNAPEWGDCTALEYEHGYVVLPSSRSRADAPEWLRPILLLAAREDCLLINFDQDEDELEGLPIWHW